MLCRTGVCGYTSRGGVVQSLNLSLKAKLMLIITAVSAFCLLVACVAFVGYERVLVRREMVRDHGTLAEMVGINSTVALLSQNHAQVAETLRAMRAEPGVMFAAVFTTDGQMFASYVRGNRKSGFIPPSLRPDGAYFEDGSLLLFRSIITVTNEQIGVVCIQSDLEMEKDQLLNYAGILSLILLGSFLIAFLLSAKLQQVFSRPILHLLQVEARVSREKDYSIRAQKHAADELGSLIDGFNLMLTQIQLRDQALRESEERFRSLLENVPIGVYRTTPEGKILHANPSLLAMLGYKSLDDLSRVDLEQQSPYVSISRREFCERLEKEGELRGFEMVWHRKDGTTIDVSENAKVIRDDQGRPLYYEGTLEDISERKRIEQMKNEFLSVVSHELRVPLTSIRGTLEWISDKAGPQLTPNMQKMLEIAARSSERMGRLINDMLDIERLESGKMVFQIKPLEVGSFLQQAVEAHQVLAQQFEVKFVLQNVPPEMKVSADADRLMQVLGNLLSNAAKFSPQGGVVTVSACRQSPSMVRISVTDQGPGIPVKFRSQVFQKFAQADSSDRRQKQGSGLGLSITKAIVERMGGRISFETQTGAGTTFFFDLPEC